MYQDVFDEKKQIAMRHYFLNELSERGVVRKYEKNRRLIVNWPVPALESLSGERSPKVLSVFRAVKDYCIRCGLVKFLAK